MAAVYALWDDELDSDTEQQALLLSPEDISRKQFSARAAIDSIGFGRTQLSVLCVCALGQMAAASQQVSVSFLVHHFGASLVLDTFSRGILASASALGLLVGGLVWGVIGDGMGRRSGFILSSLWTLVFGLLSCIHDNYEVLVVFRVLTSFGVGANLPLTFSMFCEVLPSKQRGGGVLNLLEVFWSIGAAATCAMSWWLLTDHGWRIFVFATCLPSLLSLGAVYFLDIPESPVLLLETGHVDKAQRVIEEIAKKNNYIGDNCDLLLDTSNYSLVSPLVEPIPQVRPSFHYIHGDLMHYLAKGVPLFSMYFLTALGVGLFVWLPDILEHKGITPLDMYPSLLLVYCSQIPGGLFTSGLLEFLGTRRTIAFNIFAAVSVSCLFGLSMDYTVLISSMSCMQFFLAGALGASGVYATEFFPAVIRSSGLGVCHAIYRLGAILSPSLWAMSLNISVRCAMVFGASCLAMAAVSALITSPRNKL